MDILASYIGNFEMVFEARRSVWMTLRCSASYLFRQVTLALQSPANQDWCNERSASEEQAGANP